MPAELALTRKIKNMLPLSVFLKLQYYVKTGKRLNLDQPVTFNEKIQWLKANYRLDLLQELVDKYEVRKHIREKIGEQYLNQLYGVYNTPREINQEDLPDRFVIKATHGSGMVLFCENKETFDWENAYQKLDKWLKINWFEYSREWAYKNVKPRIICERLLTDENGNIPADYKISCFNGEPKTITVIKDRFKSEKISWYDTSWNKIEMSHKFPYTTFDCPKPEKLDEILDLARVLSKELIYVRVDFYYLHGDIIFGELTFYPGKGLDLLKPEKYEKLLGEYMSLPKKDAIMLS